MKFIKRKSAVKPITGSIVDTFNVDDKITNAPSLRLMIDLLYPIGRGFIDFTDTDYSNWLGLTWIRELVGMTPIGKNINDTDFATVGKTGGEKKHTLTTSEMPNHNHDVKLHYAQSDLGVQTMTEYGFIINSGHLYKTPGATWNGGITHFGYTSSEGINQAHNNLQPYKIVSYWKRIDPNTLISFAIVDNSTSESVTYKAEEGMTWEQWVYSSYNTYGYRIISNCIVDDNTVPLNLNGTNIRPADTIVKDVTYTAPECCFVHGTQVMTTLNGETCSIEEIEEGDSIVSYNIETEENYLTQVTKIITNKSSLAMALVEFANGSKLDMTDYHPIYTENGWRSITDNKYEKLVVGDRVKTDNGWTEITNIELYILDEPITTYTLALKDLDEINDIDTNDNFYANNIVVHNATTIC